MAFPERSSVWVGREQELAVLSGAVEALHRGEGSVLWVEGEPGIGKSSLVAAGLAAARDTGCDLLWGTADQLSQRLPLRVMYDCLQVRPRSPDRRRARIAELLRDGRPGLFSAEDVVHTAVEMLISLVDELCVAAPTVLVVDDLQWADEASLAVWHHLALAVGQLPLLLVGVCRPVPRRREVRVLHAAALGCGGTVISLPALGENDVAALITGVIGKPPGPALTRLAAQAMGNPLYLRELLDALVRDRIVGPGLPDAGLSDAVLERAPASFTAALSNRLSLLPTGAVEMLRAASLFGSEFTVTDLVAVLRRPASELAVGVQDAMAAGVVVDTGRRLAFRHPLILQALYDSMPAALRAALHGEAAHALAAARADPLRVAQQLLAAQPGTDWAAGWLVGSAPVLAARAPAVAAELMQRELDHAPAGCGDREALTVCLVRTLLGMDRPAETATRARQALTIAAQPAYRAELHWMLARALFSMGHNDGAVDVVQRALARPELPAMWQARLLASLAMFQRASTGDLDAADTTGRRALSVATAASDEFAMAYALVDLWLSHSVRRDHAGAAGYVDRALEVLGDGPDHSDLREYAFDSRIFTLQNLDRWSEAELTLRHTRELARRTRGHGHATSALTAAVLLYWLGRWDDALAELHSLDQDANAVTYSGLRERGPALLWHGVAALIAGRRSQTAIARKHLRAGLGLPVVTVSDRENSDFLLAAQALAAEQEGDPGLAVSVLSPVIQRRTGEMTLTHQWLPDLVRVAIAVDDRRTARAALRACQAEAAAESRPARAAAASGRCQGLLERDPEVLRETAARYRAVGPRVELANTLEDLAAVLAGHGQAAEARTALNEAVDLYHEFGATWDIRRADSRLRQHGIRRGVRGPRPPRATTGWDALTDTEAGVAVKLAEGRSTSSIAADMCLSRRTVQTHISHILTKLGVKSRVEIAREVLRREQGVA
jgi:DNA-binding CsgD family transcriptional regulator